MQRFVVNSAEKTTSYPFWLAYAHASKVLAYMRQIEKNYRKIFYTKTFAYPLRKIKQHLDDGARATTVYKTV